MSEEPCIGNIQTGQANIDDNARQVLWHEQPRFDQTEEARIAVAISGKVVFEQEIEIPNSGGIYDLTIPSVVNAAAGETVEFHIHNHVYRDLFSKYDDLRINQF